MKLSIALLGAVLVAAAIYFWIRPDDFTPSGPQIDEGPVIVYANDQSGREIEAGAAHRFSKKPEYLRIDSRVTFPFENNFRLDIERAPKFDFLPQALGWINDHCDSMDPEVPPRTFRDYVFEGTEVDLSYFPGGTTWSFEIFHRGKHVGFLVRRESNGSQFELALIDPGIYQRQFPFNFDADARLLTLNPLHSSSGEDLVDEMEDRLSSLEGIEPVVIQGTLSTSRP